MTSIESENLRVVINSAGAEISSIQNKDGLEYMWQADPAVWPRHAPVLFPIVGKLKDNKYLIDSTTYELGQHGFARDQQFKLLENDRSSCTFELKDSSETKKIFPFEFTFQITYSLQYNRLSTHYKIINTGSDTLPFAVGAHPGFRIPLSKSEKFEDYYLEFENDSYEVTKLSNGLRLDDKVTLNLNDNKLQLNTSLFDHDALVFENGQINKIALRSAKSHHEIVMECKNWPYFGIWTKKGNREFVCLEPWFGIADSAKSNQQINSKDGIIKLDKGKDFSCSFTTIFD